MRQHQVDVAALEQWAPLIAKMSYKAAQRAAKIGSSISQEDFKQELSITLLHCLDSYNPNNEAGAKFITFLHRAFYNEINKLLHQDTKNLNGGKDTPYKEIQTIFAYKHNGIDRSYIDPNTLDKEYLDELLEDDVITEAEHKRIRAAMRRQTIRTVSGDHIAESDDGGSVDAWSYIEDESERGAEDRVMDEDVLRYVRLHVSGETCAVMDILMSGAPFLMQQLEAYNEGVTQEKADGGIGRYKLDLNFGFVCKLLGINANRTTKMANELKLAIQAYAG